MLLLIFNFVMIALLFATFYIFYLYLLRINSTVRKLQDDTNLIRAEIHANKKILNTLYNNFLSTSSAA